MENKKLLINKILGTDLTMVEARLLATAFLVNQTGSFKSVKMQNAATILNLMPVSWAKEVCLSLLMSELE